MHTKKIQELQGRLKKLYDLKEKADYLILGEIGETREMYEDLRDKIINKIEETSEELKKYDRRKNNEADILFPKVIANKLHLANKEVTNDD
jgi:hypothetical protein